VAAGPEVRIAMDRTGIRAGDYLRLSARRFPDRACFVFADGRERTFAETNSRVNRLASCLRAHGIGKGDRVAILATDSGSYAEVLFACMKLGATYVPLNYRLRGDEVATLLRRARPAAVFAGTRYAGTVRDALAGLAPPRLACVLGGDHGSGEVAGFLGFDDLLARGTDVEPDVDLTDDDILGLAFTSGTTGLPKGVRQSQRMIKALTISITLDYEIQPDEFRYSASPLFHIGGQSPLFMHVWRGFPTLVLEQFQPEAVLRWMQGGRLTGCFLVPTMISTLLELPSVTDSDYHSLRSIIYGAAPMPPALLRRAMQVFRCDFVNAFGAGTETGLQTVLSSADHRRALAGAEHLLGSIGKPAFGVDLRLIDEAGRDVPRDVVGEIATRGDQLMSGYLEMPRETAEALRDGWFRAGDLARMDADGYLYLAGRRTDMIIRGGENIYPIEIEDVLTRYPGIRAAAVVGAPDDHWGEIVVAYVTTDPAMAVEPGAVRDHCRARLAAYKVPRDVIVVPHLPVNASGKILKRELRTRAVTPTYPVRGPC
jgi:acyl-CoA synthetase (AMP-forming)/AMP-acid ligase II